MPTCLAPAKINLFLHVGPVKPNGRHDLDSLVVFAGKEAADRLSVEKAETLTLNLTGPGAAGLGAGEDNLVLRAARALARAAGIDQGAGLHLDKQLPIAAGIGGGSADAGAALRLLCGLWSADLSVARELAPGLGGDVPVALFGQSALMRGEGERIEPAGLPCALPAVLVNPKISCATGAVFEAFDANAGGAGFAEILWPDFPDGPDGMTALINWLSVQSNDLEGAACALVPEISGVLNALDALPGARLTRMSGSGASCFALFETSEDADKAEAELRASHPDWWVRATVLGER